MTKITALTALTSMDDDTDLVVVEDISGTETKKMTWANLKTSIQTFIEGLASYFNVSTGTLDDITDGVTYVKSTNDYDAAAVSKLAGIEALADVTDETNVKSSLDGATITSATVATDDKVLIQDTNDSNNLKTVTTQSIAELTDSATKQYFIPPNADNTAVGALSWTGALSNWPYFSAGATTGVKFIFMLPDDFTSLTEAKVLMIPDATETVQYDLDLNAVAAGEAYTTNNTSSVNQTQAVTVNLLEEVDVSSVFSGTYSAGDYCALSFDSDTASLRIVGLMIKYS